MKPLEPISTIMSSNIIKLNIDDNLTKAEILFKTHNIRHIPVMQDNKVVGILSNTDLQRICSVEEDQFENIQSIVYNNFTLNQVMSKQVISVFPFTPIKEVAQILSNSNFHALPVIHNDNLVGIISTVDILKYFVAQYE